MAKTNPFEPRSTTINKYVTKVCEQIVKDNEEITGITTKNDLMLFLKSDKSQASMVNNNRLYKKVKRPNTNTNTNPIHSHSRHSHSNSQFSRRQNNQTANKRSSTFNTPILNDKQQNIQSNNNLHAQPIPRHEAFNFLS